MTSDITDSVSQLLLELIEQNKALNELLKQDQGSYKSNDLIALEKSNQDKKNIQDSMQGTIASFDAHTALASHSGNYIEKFTAYAKTCTQAKRKQIEALIDQTIKVCDEGYRLVQINQAIATANINFVHDLFGEIVGQTKDSLGKTYDKSAVLSR